MSFETNIPHYETETGDKILYPFGPPIFQTEVDSKFTQELLDEGRKLDIKTNDWNNKLAGNLKYGRSYHYNEDYLNKVEPYLKIYVERYLNGLITNHFQNDKTIKAIFEIHTDRKTVRQGKLRLDTLWINFSKKHDFNPPHTHTGLLSFVIFCKVPKEIFTVQADSNTKRAGEIHFTYGDQISNLHGTEYPVKPYENLMFIFPAELKHFVPPFWVDAERVSVSGNFIIC